MGRKGPPRLGQLSVYCMIVTYERKEIVFQLLGNGVCFPAERRKFGGRHKYSSRSKSTSPMCSSQLSFRWRLCPPLIVVIPPTQPCSSNHHPIPTVSYFAALYRETRMFELSLSIFVFVCGKIKVPHNGKKKMLQIHGSDRFFVPGNRKCRTSRIVRVFFRMDG